MSDIIQDFLNILDLEKIEENLFRGEILHIGTPRVFGGQVVAQALIAASRTVSDRACHSLHGYFLRPGDLQAPIVFEVDRIRDGKSFTIRRVVAIQHGKAIFNMAASFQKHEEGKEHQADMPDVPGPEGLLNEQELKEKVIDKIPEVFHSLVMMKRPIEVRPVAPSNPFKPIKEKPVKYVWFKVGGNLPDDPRLHQAAVAYASDFGLMGTAMMPHGMSFFQRGFQAASLDHAMWFHHDFNANDWLLYAMDSPVSSAARGLNRGSIYTRDGVLVASATQEGLMRLHKPADS